MPSNIINSKFNGEIKYKKFLWEKSVWVGGFQQSGPLVNNVWKKAISNIKVPPENVLILGLGCGTVVSLIHKKFPKAKITGVEIDPVMIEIGKKYFELKNVDIRITDALKFLKTEKQKYDLIIFDIYKGNSSQANHQNFLKLLNIKGTMLVNHLVNLENTVEVVELQN